VSALAPDKHEASEPVITDACAAGNAEAGTRALETLRFLGDALLTDVAGFLDALAGRS
jgi:hypothetical protein